MIPAAHPSLEGGDPGAGHTGLRGEQPMGQCFKKMQGLLPKLAVQNCFFLPKLYLKPTPIPFKVHMKT